MPLRRKDKKEEAPVSSGLKPSLHYLHGYPVVKTGLNFIEFENGARLVFDGDTDEKLVGMSLVTTVFASNQTVVHFGHGSSIETSINLVPGTYSIVDDPRFPQ